MVGQDQLLVWVMANNTEFVILGSINKTGVIYFSWDTDRPDRRVNRTHHEESAKHADEWLQNSTDYLARTGSVFVIEPEVLELPGPGDDRGMLGSWAEILLFGYIDHRLRAEV